MQSEKRDINMRLTQGEINTAVIQALTILRARQIEVDGKSATAYVLLDDAITHLQNNIPAESETFEVWCNFRVEVASAPQSGWDAIEAAHLAMVWPE